METITGDLGDIRSLCATIEQGGITRASNLLGESKGTVSRRITRLEQQLGVKLLNRSSRVVSATAEGMAFYHRSLQALALLDEGATELRNTSMEPAGLLRVTMPVDVGISILPPLIADFLALYPKIKVEVVLTEAFLDFKTNQIDIAFRAANILPDSAYILHHLSDISLQLFASPQYLHKQGIPDRPADLIHHALLLHRLPSLQSPVFINGRNSAQLNLSTIAAVRANDFVYLKQMAIAGTGIAILPHFLGITENEELVRVLPQWSISQPGSLYLLNESWRLLPAKVNYFRDFMIDRFRQT